MILSMREQGLIFLFVCLLGFCFGFLYDLLRIFRLAFGVFKPLSAAEDFIFWVFASFAVFYFLLGVNYGEVRPYMVFGFMGGMCLYYLSLSSEIMKISFFVLSLIKRAVMRFLKPFIIIINIIKFQLKNTGKWFIIKVGGIFNKLFALRGRLIRKKKRMKQTVKKTEKARKRKNL